MDEETEPVATTVPDDDDGNSQQEGSEDEDECRVCRGPAEEGRPFFSPCKCSGSIGLTHQDCLASWLAVTRGEGRCELCKVKFVFAPQYAENAPERLSAAEVLLGLTSRAMARWLPFLLRLIFCVTLWLVVAPLMTSYLYLIWMNRSLSCVRERWTWNLLPSDAVSGAVLAAIILISFLSMMSFADFLRVEWQQQQQQDRRIDPLEPDAGRRLRRELVEAAEENRRRHHEFDNELLEQIHRERVERRQEQNVAGNVDAEEVPESPSDQQDQDSVPAQQNEPDGIVLGQQQDHHDEIQAIGNPNEADRGDRGRNNEDNNENVNNNNGVRGGQNDDNGNNNGGGDGIVPDDAENRNNAPDPREDARAQRANPRPDRQFDPNMNGDPLLQDDQVDMEINVALDELLGLRGPINSLLRNLLWLLVFNTIYLGFFAFIPKAIGSASFSVMMNNTVVDNAVSMLPELRSQNETTISLGTALNRINEESEKLNTIFRFPHVASINLGYLVGAAIVIFLRLLWFGIAKIRRVDDGRQATPRARRQDAPIGAVDALDEAQRLHDANINAFDDNDLHARIGDGLENQGIAAGEALGLVLDAMVSVVKVGVLLFLKMFLLPVLLGIWLDGASMALFGSNANDMILFAGRDLFSFILLHWVAGITFMLLVTVSVLQLREVAHPDLLAHLIRPQEPQPDLLGNLMHDSVVTQTKRMILSLGIYTALLHLHISIPVKLMMASGISDLMPFLKLKFWHLLMPQLQVPLELIVFHLSMLALLEKYKNSIGKMQHHWLVFMSSRMGLTKFILPQDVEKFVLIGHIPVCKNGTEVNKVLYDLANGVGDCVDLISSNVQKVDPGSSRIMAFEGQTKDNGERVLVSSVSYILLPAAGQDGSGGSGVSTSGDDENAALLPTKMGRFRLKRREEPSKEPAIEIWEEVAGKPIPRPPEGWDDLGAGGADIQGRWAWGKEKKSVIERGVAQRSCFFGPHGKAGTELLSLIARALLLVFFSWLATTLLLIIAVSAPLGVGRLLYIILRVPEKFHHHPLSFAVGGALAYPALAFVGSLLSSIHYASVSLCFKQWIDSFRLPPARKAGVLCFLTILWLLIDPLTLGLIYELCFIKTASWFSGEKALVAPTDFLVSWVVGTVLLNTWAFLCSVSFFTKEFWVNMGNGMLEVEGENRRGRQEAANGDQDDAGPAWQGKDGRTARFFACLKAVLGNFEWDAIDHVVLLSDCAIPISKTLCTLLLAPLVCYLLWFWSMDALVGSDELSGSHRLYVYRLASASTLFLQLCTAFRKQIQRWFGAVHKTARDDRYLIGEVLLNYRQDLET